MRIFFRPITAFRASLGVLLIVAFSAIAAFPRPVPALPAFILDGQTNIIGAMGEYRTKNDESLYEIARTFKTGYNEIVAANPGIDPYVPGAGTLLTLPTAWILPDAARNDGIVINVSEMRLYYYYTGKGRRYVRTYPIGIGDEGNETPLGAFRIIEKIAHPSWYVPDSIRKEKPELPAVVPPGPDNPMGSHALRLSRRTVLIHGTDIPWGIGRRVSHGCIRLYPEDISELFKEVPVGERVTIVRQPIKATWERGHVYVEVNEDDDLPSFDYWNEANLVLMKKGFLDNVDPVKLNHAVRDKRGYPVDVSLNRRTGPQ